MRWIAWKHRLSKAQEESQALKRPAKVPRLEELFYDEIPTRELPQGMVGVGFVQSILGLVSTSFALLGKAHLHNLRLYERKFLKLAFQKHEASSGLRQLNLEEMQCADRKVWELLSDLVNLHNWSLNDALTEVCEVRGDLASLLQPRPAIPKVQYHGKGFGKPSHPGKGKGKGGGHPSSGKGRSRTSGCCNSRIQSRASASSAGDTLRKRAAASRIASSSTYVPSPAATANLAWANIQLTSTAVTQTD